MCSTPTLHCSFIQKKHGLFSFSIKNYFWNSFSINKMDRNFCQLQNPMDFMHASQRYLSAGFTLKKLGTLSFDELLAFISEPASIAVTKDYLRHLMQHAAVRHLNQTDGAYYMVKNTKAFLSSFMIHLHPERVFKVMGSTENELLAKAKQLVLYMDTISTFIDLSDDKSFEIIPWTMTMRLFQLASDYYEALRAWKKMDAARALEAHKAAIQKVTTLIEVMSMNGRFPSSPAVLDAEDKLELLKKSFIRIAGVQALEAFEETML